MPIEQNFLKRRNCLVRIALLTYLLLPCERVFGATISFGFKDGLFAELAGQAETFLEESVMTWDAIAEEVMASATQVEAIELAIANWSSDSQERDNENNNNLSIGTLVDAFGQLKLSGARPGNSQSNVAILPQVGYADPNRGIYAFDATTAPRNKPTNSIIFNLNPIHSSTSARPNAYKVANFGVVSLNASFPTASVLGARSNFGLMDINVGLQLLPQTPIPTPINLKNDFAKTSDLLRSDLQFTSPLQTQVQQKVQQQSQQRYQQQQQREQRYRQRWLEQQRRQQEAAQQKLARQQERQQRQLQRQLERQRRLQASYQQQMERQWWR